MSNNRIKVEGVKCVLLDVEGTVCPISFVKETLFPYALAALPNVLQTQWDSPAFIPHRDAFPPAHATDPTALQAHVQDLTARDVKIGYLKSLQGYLWERGYKEGAYATELFDDVVPVLRQWRESEGLGLAVYSSGSVFAQKLLFGHVREGDGRVRDLTGWFGGFWDTGIGGKLEVESYGRITAGLELKPEEVLFLTDNHKEAEAAYGAGMKTVITDRPGNAELPEAVRASYDVVNSLEELEVSRKPKGPMEKGAETVESSTDELSKDEARN